MPTALGKRESPEQDASPPRPEPSTKASDEPKKPAVTEAGDPFPSPRPVLSTFLRPGARFKGVQTTENQTHEVGVEIKSADLESASVTGYLSIAKLTANLPSLTTYFEGEIISDKYSFITNHKDWGASRESDILHWGRFDGFENLNKKIGEFMPDFVFSDYQDQDFIFMRWKERFLIPDYRVKELQGASFSGFYYICLDQKAKKIVGFYYQREQSPRERFQTINLDYIDDKGCGTYQFR